MTLLKAVIELKKAHDRHGISSPEFSAALEAVYQALEENRPKPITLEIQDSTVGVVAKFGGE